MNQHERAATERMSPEPEHERIREMLPEYAMIRVSGRTPAAEWCELEAHLASCTECRDEAEELLQLLVDTNTGNLPAEPASAAPDLSFLASPPQPTPTTRAMDRIADSIRGLVIQFSEALLATLRQPGLAGAYRGEHYCSYEHPRDPDRDLHITIDVSVEDMERKLCRVLVSVVNPRNPFEQEGSVVTLRFGTFTHEMTTDHQGYAAFTDIPLDFVSQLQFTITPRRTD